MESLITLSNRPMEKGVMKTETFRQPLDDLVTDLLVTTIFEDERPPRGVTGLIDWRLNGFLSQTILSRNILGTHEEMNLIPVHHRLGARRLLLVGLGKKQDFTSLRARELSFRIASMIKDIQTMDASIYIPPTKDERIVGTTQRAVMDAIRRSPLPSDLMVRWIDDTIIRPLEFAIPDPSERKHLQEAM